MTEQELKDGEAYQASLPGTAAILAFELERVTKALEAMAGDRNTLLPELDSIGSSAERLDRFFALLWKRGGS